MKNFTCLARYQRDNTMHCPRCNLTWDCADDDRPACLTPQEIAHGSIAQSLAPADHPPVFKTISYSNANLVVEFTLGKFQGINIGAGEPISHVVDKLRSLATLIERGIK